MLLCCLLFSALLSAQSTAFVSGQITNAHLVKTIDIQVNQKYLNNDHSVYSSEITEDGGFAFELDIYEPILVTIVYSRNKTFLYLEPNDTLFINCDAQNFPFSVAFSGPAADNNQMVQSYFQQYPREMNPFKMVQYRQGNFWFANNPQMEEWMNQWAPPTFVQQMDNRRKEAEQFLLNKRRRFSGLSENCWMFLEAELEYDYAYHRLLYGHVYKNKYQIGDSYFDFLSQTPTQHRQTGNYWYRQFLLAYVSHLATKEGGAANQSYSRQYDLAQEHFHDRALSFLQSEYIVRGFLSKKAEEVLPKYESFSRTNPYIQYEEKVINAYRKAMKYAEGALAPDIILTDRNGQSKSLSSFRGQVVYLNFWASWCKPCLRKMELMKPMQAELEEQGVVFFNVSLDRSTEAWTDVLDERELQGVHVLAETDQSNQLMRNYNVQVLPQYYILNKSGQFAAKPEAFDPVALRSQLMQLSK